MRQVFCAPCARTLEASRSPDAVFVYGGALAAALTSFKYASRPDLARSLGHLLVRATSRFAGRVDLVAPVPLHASRLADRGYNQSALLARPLAAALGVPFAARLIERTRPTPRQAELDRAARRENVLGAFRVRTPDQARGRRVLVVDDVKTTGATLGACATALDEAGAAKVLTIVLAEARLEHVG